MNTTNFSFYQQFACDWVKPNSTHEQGFEACVEALADLLRTEARMPAEAAAQFARNEVATWGNLSREAE